MKNKNLYILLAIAAGYYFYYNKKKKKGTVIVSEFLPLQGNEAEIMQRDKFVYSGELATVPTAQKIRELPAVQKTLDTIKNRIFATAKKQVKTAEKKIVQKVQAKKAQVKKTQNKKSRLQKLGELGALYI
jgi:hypothetical protein